MTRHRPLIEAIYRHIRYYNHDRIHTALKMPPAVFAAQSFSDTRLQKMGTCILEQLREMVEGDVDQWKILKALPDYTWKALQERYAYQFGKGCWRTAYAGHKPYGRYTRWRSTEECKAEQEHPPQLKPSEGCTDTCTSPHKARQYEFPPITVLAA